LLLYSIIICCPIHFHSHHSTKHSTTFTFLRQITLLIWLDQVTNGLCFLAVVEFKTYMIMNELWMWKKMSTKQQINILSTHCPWPV
jgi:hypothetical protein